MLSETCFSIFLNTAKLSLTGPALKAAWCTREVVQFSLFPAAHLIEQIYNRYSHSISF